MSPHSMWIVMLGGVVALAGSQEETKRPGKEDLRGRAQEIVRKNQDNEITTTEARRQVELLLRDLRKWGEETGTRLTRRTRTFSAPATAPGEVLTADRCPLFFEEDLARLCPLDFSRSEVWGATVVFCRYLCTPEET